MNNSVYFQNIVVCNEPFKVSNLQFSNMNRNVQDISELWSKLNCRPEVFLRKGVLKIMQQIYRRTPMPKCDLNKVV